MNRDSQRKSGFTLLETAVVLILVSILSAMAGMYAVPLARAFVQVRRTTEAAQKVETAMLRVSREFTAVTEVSAGSSSSITYRMLDQSGNPVWRTLSWAGSGTPLLLDGVALLDGVSAVNLQYVSYSGGTFSLAPSWSASTRGIQLQVSVTDAPGVNYAVRIFPRNR